MRLTSLTRPLAASLSLAFLVGCASTATTNQDSDTQNGSASASAYGDERSGATATGLSGKVFEGSRNSNLQSHNGQSFDSQAPQERILYFAFDNDRILPDSAEILYAHADYLKGNSEARVTLQGHTDNRGTREYNMALGERRALSAQNFLTMLDVPTQQLSVVSYGEEKPAARGDSNEDHAQNRRVIILYP